MNIQSSAIDALQLLIGLFLLGTAATASAFTNITWKAAVDGNLDEAQYWDLGRVPDYKLNSSNGDIMYFPPFAGTSSITLGLKDDFFGYELKFTDSNTSQTDYVLNLAGKTLSLAGLEKGDTRLTVAAKASLTVTNGVLAYQSSNRPYLSLIGKFVAAGPTTVVSNFTYLAYSASVGDVTFKDGALYYGGNSETSPGGSVTFTGEGTRWIGNNTKTMYGMAPPGGILRIQDGTVVSNVWRLWCGGAGAAATAEVSRASVYIADGGVLLGNDAAACSNRMTIADGSLVKIYKNYQHKGELVVGSMGGDNTLVISGATTRVELVDPQYGAYIGKGSNNNLLHVTDGASLAVISDTHISPDPNDSSRAATSENNCLLVDKGATYSARYIYLGRTCWRADGKTQGPPTHYASNRVVFASAAQGSFDRLYVATDTNINHSVFRVTGTGTRVESSISAEVGYYGISNRLEVADGGVLEVPRVIMGGTTSTGSCISVVGSGSTLIQTNNAFTFNGAASGHYGVLRVADGGVFRSGYLSDSGKDGMLVDIDDAMIDIILGNSNSGGWCEFAAGTEFRFRGRNATLRTSYDNQGHIGFRSAVNSVHLHFEVPEDGFANPPFDFSIARQKFCVWAPPTASFELAAWRHNGGGKQVLIDALGGIDFQNTTPQAVLDSMSATLPDTRCRLYFVDSNGKETTTAADCRKLILRASSSRGEVIIFR